MVARRVARGGFRRGGLRQRTDWTRTVFTAETVIPAATKVLMVSYVPLESEVTVRRSIVSMNIRSDQAAATELQVGALGMHVANDNAIAAGAASLLGPSTDRSDDAWFLWAPIMQAYVFGSAVGFENAGGRLYSVDSRAQRRIQEGQSIAVMVENAHATHAFSILLGISVLAGAGLRRS